jgi:hypothetical protein
MKSYFNNLNQKKSSTNYGLLKKYKRKQVWDCKNEIRESCDWTASSLLNL